MKKEIIDNYCSQEYFDKLSEIVLSPDFPWFYQDTVSGPSNNDDFYFTHCVYKHHRITSELYDMLIPLFESIQIKSLIRVKFNLYPNLGTEITNDPHIDYEFQHNGAILYLNTNNGFTVLEDGERISSIKNRLLLFDASKKHYSTHCTDKKIRVNMNINYF